MSDRYRSITNRIVQFVAGERPSADKFNRLVSYFRNNIQSINNVIGDIEGTQNAFSVDEESVDLSLDWGRRKDAENALDADKRRFLDIATIGRLIGPSSNLNARELTDTRFYIENEEIPTGSTVYHPLYPIDTESDVVINGFTETEDTPVGFEYQIVNDGKEIIFGVFTGGVDPATGIVGSNISYYTKPSSYAGGSNYQGARFNVIPDPNDLGKLNFDDIDESTYTIELPYVSNLQSSLINDFTTISTSETGYIDNSGTKVKYKLPKVLVDKYGVEPEDNSLEAVKQRPIPEGFLYLKCETTSEVFKESQYYYVNESKILVENIDLGDCNLQNDVFRIVTVGTDITTSIDDLRVKFKKHAHDGSYGESRVSIENLAEIYNNQGSTAPYFKSLHSKNPISYYLHRDGYKEGDDLNANNMMRGHLVIGSKDNGASIRNGSLSDLSYSLVLGYSSLNLIDSEVKYLPSSPRIRRGENESLDILASQGGDINVESLEKIKIAATKSVEDNVSAVSIQGGNSPVNADIRMIGVEPSAGESYHAIQAKAKRVALEGEMTSVIGNFFEAGNVDYYESNDENANIKRRPEETLTGILENQDSAGLNNKRDVKNIISGARINKDYDDISKIDSADVFGVGKDYRRSYLNINATLFRRERELYQIGYSNADIPALYYDANKIIDTNGNNPIGGYVIKSSHADIFIGGYSGLTNNDSGRFIYENDVLLDGYVNIILDLGYDERGYPIYKNQKAGKEFEISILYTKDIIQSFASSFKGIRFLTVGPFIKTCTFIKNGKPYNDTAGITGDVITERSYITKYANSDVVGQYKYIGGVSPGAEQFRHRLQLLPDNFGSGEWKIAAGTCLKIKGVERHYPIIIDGSGGLSNPENSQENIHTAYTCEIILEGVSNETSLQDLFGTD